MGATIEKHREEARNYSVDFASEMGDNESLTGSPTITVFSGSTDVTSQFGPTNVTVSGTKVEWTLAKASGDDQDGGVYDVKVEVSTDNNQALVSVHPLNVSEKTAAV